eukprot:TRINITY_DN80172_c0_g1_i1.p1 TRINITY_DN80172_c0_g1~~TRINITY_DN80172_c0_g1_i1.p1  ORF type:complete len:666 (-),score=123.53 TRINITY_DN80172_c0_g1_i1:91-2088(-)
MEGLKSLIRERLHASPKVQQLLLEQPELKDDPAALLALLEERGLVEDIFTSLETTLQKQPKWPAAGASAGAAGGGPPPGEQEIRLAADVEQQQRNNAPRVNRGLTSGLQIDAGIDAVRAAHPFQICLRLVEGRAFLDFLEAQGTGVQLQWEVSFGAQRLRSRPVAACVDPRFDTTLFLALPQARSRSALLEHASPIHLILTSRSTGAAAEDGCDVGSVSLLCSHQLDWRPCLAVAGPRKLTVELHGVGRRSQLSTGVLHCELEILPAYDQCATELLLAETDVKRQVAAEEQRRAEIMRKVFEELDSWWAQYYRMFQSRYICLFAQTENGLFLPVTSFLTPLEAGRALDGPGHAFRWASLLVTEPRPAMESSEPRWHTLPALWARGRGTVEEKTLLLTSLLLGYSIDAWFCLGTDAGGQPHAWTLVRQRGDSSAPADVVCWDTRVGLRISADSPQYLTTYSSIDFVFNDRRLHVCHADSAARATFDFSDPRCWLPVPLNVADTEELRLYPASRNPPFADLKAKLWALPMDAEVIEETIEQRLLVAMRSHREALGLGTAVDEHLAQLMHLALVDLEAQRIGNAGTESYFADVVQRVCAAGEVFRAIPVQFNHLRLSLFWPTLSERSEVREALALSAGPIAFAVRARVVLYPEGVVAAWVLFAVRGAG